MAIFQITILLLIKTWTFWYIDRLPTSSYTGVTYFQKWSGFFGPPCIFVANRCFCQQCYTVRSCYLCLSHIRKSWKQHVINFSDRYWGSLGETKSVYNEEVTEKTAVQKLELIINERRLRWFVHVSRIDDGRLQTQVMHWEANTTKWRSGRRRINTVKQDLKDISMSCEEAHERCVDRPSLVNSLHVDAMHSFACT